jgi:hypothetical protein
MHKHGHNVSKSGKPRGAEGEIWWRRGRVKDTEGNDRRWNEISGLFKYLDQDQLRRMYVNS